MLALDVLERMKEAGLSDVPVVVGGIIPRPTPSVCREAGVARVYTPKDFLGLSQPHHGGPVALVAERDAA
ncbi:MAG: hypothetical protein R3B99_36820 [Polyangiales bacterium]